MQQLLWFRETQAESEDYPPWSLLPAGLQVLTESSSARAPFGRPQKKSAGRSFSGMACSLALARVTRIRASEQVGVIVAIDRLIEAPAYNQTQTFGARDFQLC